MLLRSQAEESYLENHFQLVRKGLLVILREEATLILNHKAYGLCRIFAHATCLLVTRKLTAGVL